MEVLWAGASCPLKWFSGMRYDGRVADVLGVAVELGVMGCVVAKVVGWYLEFCENLAKPLATSSPTMFLVNLACSKNVGRHHQESQR
jgi:hypothetical protein